MNLQGETAVVTGAARGIGRAYCERLASNGANLVLVDLEEATGLVQKLPGPGEKLALAAAAGGTGRVAAIASAVLDRFGRCDISVNNAALMPMTSLDTVTSDLWRRVQAANVEPIAHFARPEDVAGALAWLVSTDADFVTGEIVHVDGGRTRSGA